MHASAGTGSIVFGLPPERQASSGACVPAAGQQQQQQPEREQQEPQPEQEQQQQAVQETLALLQHGLASLGASVLAPAELHSALLLKLLMNCAANPLTALLHCRNGGLCTPHGEKVFRAVVAEAKAVWGDALPGSEEQLLAHVNKLCTTTGSNFNSMLQSIVAGAATEIPYLNGWLVEQAAARGLRAPTNELLATLVRAREAAPRDSLTRESLE